MTADYCLLLVFGNSGENNLLLLEADMCVCVCVCVKTSEIAEVKPIITIVHTSKRQFANQEDSNQNKE